MRATEAPDSTSAEIFRQRSAIPEAADAWFVFVVASVLLFAYSNHAVRALLYDEEPYRVFGSYWVSGWAANHHLDPYAAYPLTWHFHAFANDGGPVIWDVNLNPPLVLPLFQFVAHFALGVGVVASWTVISVLLFACGTALLLVKRRGQVQKRAIIWLLLSAPVINTLWLGQNYALIYAAACLVWFLIESERTDLAAILIGLLIAMKLNLGLWPIFLLIAGFKRAAIVSVSTAAALTVFPAVLYGPSIYVRWIRAASQVPHDILSSDISLAGIFARLGSRAIGIAIAALLAIGLTILVRRERPSIESVCGLSVCAGIFCAPLAWYHYVLIVAPFFASRRWKALETWAAALLALPVLFQNLIDGPSRLGVLAITLPHIFGLSLMLLSFTQFQRRKVRPLARNLSCV